MPILGGMTFDLARERPLPRRRCSAMRLRPGRPWTVAAWVLASIASLAGVVTFINAVTFSGALADDPVRATATVTSVYINGFGGDPTVDYRYTVAGRTHHGSGRGELGHEDVLSLDPGDRVAINYARYAPSHSCTCKPGDEPHGTATAAGSLLLVLPMLWMLWRERRRARKIRQRTFEN